MQEQVRIATIKEKYRNIFPLDLKNRQIGLVPNNPSTKEEKKEKE